ncbi:ankyrin repeat domain-containing protein [Acerihabitans arboris]|nr:ankyrin repeat domain-containing protein [Acerihabitans arboris]
MPINNVNSQHDLAPYVAKSIDNLASADGAGNERIIYTQEKYATFAEFETKHFKHYIRQTRNDLERLAERLDLADYAQGNIKHFISLMDKPEKINESNKYAVYNQLGCYLEKLSSINKETCHEKVALEIRMMFSDLNVCTPGAITHISDACKIAADYMDDNLITQLQVIKKNLIMAALSHHLRKNHDNIDPIMEIHYGNAYIKHLRGTEWDIGDTIEDMHVNDEIKKITLNELGILEERLKMEASLVEAIKTYGNDLYGYYKKIHAEYTNNKVQENVYDDRAAKMMYEAIDEYNRLRSVDVKKNNILQFDNDVTMLPTAEPIFCTIVESLAEKYGDKGYEFAYFSKREDFDIKTLMGMYWLSEKKSDHQSLVTLETLRQKNITGILDKELLYFAINHTHIENIDFLMDAQWIGDLSKTFTYIPNYKIFKALGSFMNKTKIDENYHDQDGNNILMLCALFNDINMINKIIRDAKIDLDQQDRLGNTALTYFACHAEGHAAIKILLENDVNINHYNNNGDTALILSARNNCLNTVELLLAKGANVHHKNKQDSTAIMTVAEKGYIDMAKIFFDKKADINLQCADIGAAFFQAILHKKPPVVELLVENGANINYAHDGRATGLMAAVVNEDINMVRYLINMAGIDIFYKNNLSMNALIIAITTKNVAIATLLLEKAYTGFDAKGKEYNVNFLFAVSSNDIDKVKDVLKENNVILNFENQIGNAALYLALAAHNHEIVSLLLENNKGDANHDNQWAQTALFATVKYGRPDTLRVLLNKFGSIINCVDSARHTPLLYAALYNEIEMVKLLLEYSNLDINHKSELNDTALLYAVTYRSFEMAKLLLEKQPDVNVANDSGMTSLMSAVKNNDIMMVKLLLDVEDVDVNYVNKFDQSAFSIAVKDNNIALCTLLLEKQADVNFTDVAGNTALIYAIKSNNLDMINFLMNIKQLNVAHRNRQGEDALIIALTKKNRGLAHRLIDRINIDLKLNGPGRVKDFLLAVIENNLQVVENLFKENELVLNLAECFFDAALHLAITNKNLAIVKVLLKKIDNNFANYMQPALVSGVAAGDVLSTKAIIEYINSNIIKGRHDAFDFKTGPRMNINNIRPHYSHEK